MYTSEKPHSAHSFESFPIFLFLCTYSHERGWLWINLEEFAPTDYTRYVAMHVMQEDNSAHSHDGVSSGNGYSDGSMSISQRKAKGPDIRDTLATVAGMLLPLLTQLGHHH